MARARPVGINHVALEVGDLDAALELYGRLFDLRLRGRVPGMAFIDLGDQFLALAEGSGGGGGPGHFGLVVDDRDAVRAALRGGRGAAGRRTCASPTRGATRSRSSSTPTSSSPRTSAVLRGMGLSLSKTEDAQAELREKGLL